MFFASKFQAVAYARSQEVDIPTLRGRLRIVQDTRTKWCRKTGEPLKEAGFTICLKG